MKVTTLCQELIQSARTTGFVSLPMGIITQPPIRGERHTEVEALIALCALVNFRDRRLKWEGRWVVCARGESIRSMYTWGSYFGWRVEEVREFFRKLTLLGYMEPPIELICADHIRIRNYDQLTGREPLIEGARRHIGGAQRQVEKIAEKPPKDPVFEEFWKAYHEITCKPALERSRTRRIWDGLTKDEQDLAIDNIEVYYHGLTDRKYCRKAATYLEERVFD